MKNSNFPHQNDKGLKLIQNVSFGYTLTFSITWEYYKTVWKKLWREYNLHKKQKDKIMCILKIILNN